MEQFEIIVGVIMGALPLIFALVSMVVKATPGDRDDIRWGKVQSFIGRFFSLKERADPSTGKAAWKAPGMSDTPKSQR